VPDDDSALFAEGVVLVVEDPAQRVLEHGQRLLERHTVPMKRSIFSWNFACVAPPARNAAATVITVPVIDSTLLL